MAKTAEKQPTQLEKLQARLQELQTNLQMIARQQLMHEGAIAEVTNQIKQLNEEENN